MKINAIVASRMTSSRLPGKILMDLAGKPALVQLIRRLKRSKYLSDIVIATTINQDDDVVVEVAKKENVKYFRGSENDVLLRTVQAAEATDTEYIVQITSDCPLIDAETIDCAIEHMLKNSYVDYVSNRMIRTYPIGFDTEVFRTKELRSVEQNISDAAVREHVSLYFYEHPELYHLSNVEAPLFLRHPEYRLTLDTKEDYQLIQSIYNGLYPEKENFNLYDIIRFLEKNKNLSEINKDIIQKKARI